MKSFMLLIGVEKLVDGVADNCDALVFELMDERTDGALKISQ